MPFDSGLSLEEMCESFLSKKTRMYVIVGHNKIIAVSTKVQPKFVSVWVKYLLQFIQ